MGKKYFDTKPGTLESTVIGVWTDAIKEQDGEYKKVFQAAMKKFGVKSPSEFKDEKKKKEFFDYVDAQYINGKFKYLPSDRPLVTLPNSIIVNPLS
mgnify:CR=1 FL=1